MAEFAANNVPSESTAVSPFYANYEYNPRLGVEPATPCPPNFSAQQKRGFFKANKVATRFEQILDQLKALAKQSQYRYEENANRHREDAPLFEVGDEVFVNTKNMKTNRPVKRGDVRWIGPFTVTEAYSRACRVKLPEDVKIFNVFHHSLLQRKNPMNTDGSAWTGCNQ